VETDFLQPIEKMERGGIAKVKQYPLSDDDLRRLLGSDIKIWRYPQLGDLTSIDQLFDDKGRAIVLFPTFSPTSGHWTALIRRPKGIEFFDPYGDAPDTDQRDGLTRTRLEQLDMDQPYMTRLLRSSGLPVFYNNFGFQKDKASVATCGRHAAVRLLYAPYSLDRYKAIIDSSGLSPDDFVSGITFDKLRK
jgi:hypothetical protein